MAGSSSNRVLWNFFANTKNLEKGLKAAQRGMKATDKASGKMQTAMGGVQRAAGALGVAIGVRGLVNQIGSAISRAEEMDSQYAITESVIESTGGAAEVTAGHVKDMAAEMAMTTGIDKAVITEAQNVLLTFTNLKNEAGEMGGSFDRATKLTADMATVFGGSAKDAAKQLGKALNDPVAGISALSRVGVQFTKDQKAVIASMVEVGDVSAAQNVILMELEKQVGGTAAASADATAIMARSFDEVSEAIGQELLPVVKDIAPDVVAATKTAVKGISSFSLGVQTAQRASKGLWRTITFGLVGSVSKADDALYDFDKTVGFATQQVRDGRDAIQTMAEWMLHLAEKGTLTADNLDRMQDALELTDEDLRKAAKGAAQWARDMDLGTEAVQNADYAVEELNQRMAEDLVRTLQATGDEAVDVTAPQFDELGRRISGVTGEVETLIERMSRLNQKNLAVDEIADKTAQGAAQAARSEAVTGATQGEPFATGGIVPGPLGSAADYQGAWRRACHDASAATWRHRQQRCCQLQRRCWRPCCCRTADNRLA